MAQILLLEPDVVLSQIYVSALEGAANTVSPAFDAQTAIDIADKNPPDLVILELQLSVHNGLEFLYEFRSYAEWQTTPVIVQSFVPPSEFRSTPALWRELGVVTYLYKPRVDLHQLLTCVQEQLAVINV